MTIDCYLFLCHWKMFLLIVTYSHIDSNTCDKLHCPPSQECKMDRFGTAKCTCLSSCPHILKPGKEIVNTIINYSHSKSLRHNGLSIIYSSSLKVSLIC